MRDAKNTTKLHHYAINMSDSSTKSKVIPLNIRPRLPSLAAQGKSLGKVEDARNSRILHTVVSARRETENPFHF